jgi:hypothetical protein
MKEGNKVRSMMRQPTNSIEEEEKKKKKSQQQQQIQLKLSTIFKYKILDTPQVFGSFYDENGEKYCAVSVLSKYLGYDIAAEVSKKIQNYKKDTNTAELIPYDILEMIENLVVYSNNEGNLKCFCSKPPHYYHYSLISLLIHLNDYHKMTFTQIGNWLENIGM